MGNFLTSDNLPLNDLFIELPYKTEKVSFTGVVSNEQNDGYDNFITAQTKITNSEGVSIYGSIRFNYCLNTSKFIKKLDSNFYQTN